MRTFVRYAVYWMPPDDGPGEEGLATFGGAWLGWDAASGREVAHPVVEDLSRPVAALTDAPRRYGLHATLKPPFRLAAGVSEADLLSGFDTCAAHIAPADADALVLARLGRFLALRPEGDETGIGRVAAACVERLDGFRADPTEADLARRRAAGLSDAEEAHLLRWGYPYVMDGFRFHVTLTGPLPDAELAEVETALAPRLAPLLPRPFRLDRIALCGERPDGRFELIRRAALQG